MELASKCPVCGGNFGECGAPVGVVDDVPERLDYATPRCGNDKRVADTEEDLDGTTFSEGYFNLRYENFKSTGTLLCEGEDWILGFGLAPIDKTPAYAEIDLKVWPCRLYVDWNDWERFIEGGYRDDLSPEALEKASHIIHALEKIAPDQHALNALRQQVQGCTCLRR